MMLSYARLRTVLILCECLVIGGLGIVAGEKNPSRTKRSTLSAFPAHFNATLVRCSDVAGTTRMMQPSSDLLLQMFKGMGGNYVTDYIAATASEAADFPNMLELTAALLTPSSMRTNFSMNDNFGIKKTIMEDLDKLKQWVLLHVNSNASTPTPPISQPDNTDKPTTNPPGYTDQTQKVTSTVSKNTTTSDPRNHSNNVTVIPNGTNFTIPTKTTAGSTKSDSFTKSPRVSTDSPVHKNSTYYVTTTTASTAQFTKPHSPPDQTKGTTMDPDVAKSLEELNKYLHGGLGLSSTDLDRVWREANTTHPPQQLLALTLGSKRKRRNADGSVSHVDYCQPKGSQTDDGFLHMCTTCAVTTTLPEGRFPRIINEAVCDDKDRACLTVSGRPHGECKQRTFTLNLMRRKAGSCLLITDQGRDMYLEDWEMYPQKIRVCCECTINKLSVFSQYVAPQPIPLG